MVRRLALLLLPSLALPAAAAGSRRAWLAPTGSVAPAGALDLEARLLFVGATYALADRLELGVGGLLLAGEQGRLYTFSGKVGLVAGRRGALALTGDAFALGSPTSWIQWIGLPGLAGSLCLSAACRTVLSGYAAAPFVRGRLAGWPVAALSTHARITPGAELMVEADLGVDRLDTAFQSPLVWYGLRLGGRRLAFDLGMFIGTDYFFGAPWMALAYRPLPGSDARDDDGPRVDPSRASLRKGATFEVGLGLAHARAIQAYDPGRGVDALGWTPVVFGAGVFLSPRFALGARTTTLLFGHDPGNGRRTHLSVFAGLTGEWWLHDELAIAAGLGATALGARPFEANLARGVAASVRVSWAIMPLGSGALKVSWELQPGVFLNYEVTLGSMLLLQWQRF